MSGVIGEDETPHLFACLTQREWKMLFAVAFVDQAGDYADCYHLSDFASSDRPGKADCWEELFFRAIRMLAKDHGYEFEAVRVLPSGGIGGHEAIAPANMLYYSLLASGQLPHVRMAIESAIEDLTARCPQFDLQPLREAREAVINSVKAAPVGNPESRAALEAFRRDALASVGAVKERLN
jgi:hypothetical protein